MEGVTYYKDGAARVLQLLKDTFGEYFKAYFDGEAVPRESYLPCVMVATTRSSVAAGATGTDEITEEILIMVVMDRKNDIGAPSDQDLTEYKLRKIVMGQDLTTQQFVPETVMYALRTFFTLNDAYLLDQSITIDFTPNARGTIDAPINTMEAYITLTITRLAFVPSRT
jgi:hypothetical protein